MTKVCLEDVARKELVFEITLGSKGFLRLFSVFPEPFFIIFQLLKFCLKNFNSFFKVALAVNKLLIRSCFSVFVEEEHIIAVQKEINICI
jgi:hypothetical protein